MAEKERISVLGAGSWGATLACLLSDKGHSVSLWEFDPKASETLRSTRRLSVLPELQLPSSIEVTSDLAAALQDRSVILSVTPSGFVRSTMNAVHSSDSIHPQALIISASKGLEELSLKRMSEVISEELSIGAEHIGVLSGPSHAEEVFRHLPTAAVGASTNPEVSARIQRLFSQDYFRVYTASDMTGVELGGTLKNVFAIACGISDGLGLGDNTKAALMTRGLQEMGRLGVKLGAQIQTFYGLAGMGDLIVTCLSQHSRNRLFGEKIGGGKTPQAALAEMTMVVEGYKNTGAAFELARRLNIECPLIQEIYNVLYQGKNPRVSLHDLMGRESQQEG